MMAEHPDVFSSLQHFDHIIKIVAWGGGRGRESGYANAHSKVH